MVVGFVGGLCECVERMCWFTGNYIGPEGAASIVAAMQCCTSLTSMNLSGEYTIDMDGCRLLLVC